MLGDAFVYGSRIGLSLNVTNGNKASICNKKQNTLHYKPRNACSRSQRRILWRQPASTHGECWTQRSPRNHHTVLAKESRLAIFCGLGGNGGDGFVAARHLLAADFEVTVVLVGRGRDISHEAALRNLDDFSVASRQNFFD